MEKTTIPVDLTDEQILSSFVKHFECDGAILIYLDRAQEYGFSKWKNENGQTWANDVFRILKNGSRVISRNQRQNRKSAKTQSMKV